MTDEGARYQLRVTAPAARHLNQLPPRIAVAVVEFMLGPLLDEPRRIGGPLRRELAGVLSARRGAYRVIYEVDDEALVVVVHRFDHRASAYRPR